MKRKFFILVVCLASSFVGLHFILHPRNKAFFSNGQFLHGKIAMKFDKFACNLTHDEALQKVSDLTFNVSDDMLERLGLGNTSPPTDIPRFPVIVTGADNSHYMESQALIQNLHQVVLPAVPKLKLVYFDLGLAPEYRKQLEKYCRCTVIDFPFDVSPPHVRKLQTYAFKPIAVNIVFKTYGHVLWLDASIRFESRNFHTNIYGLFKRLQEDQIYFYGFTIDPNGTLLQRTLNKTFSYFYESPSCYLNKAERIATLVGVRNSKESQIFLRQWLACALIEDCINPPGALLICPNFRPDLSLKYAGLCHRFDQSILGIMWYRMYPDEILRMPSWIMIKGGHTASYFPKL